MCRAANLTREAKLQWYRYESAKTLMPDRRGVFQGSQSAESKAGGLGDANDGSFGDQWCHYVAVLVW